MENTRCYSVAKKNIPYVQRNFKNKIESTIDTD